VDGVRRESRIVEDLPEAKLRLQTVRPAEDHLEIIQDTTVVPDLDKQLSCVGRVVMRLVNMEAWSRPQRHAKSPHRGRKSANCVGMFLPAQLKAD
jgi:hypothetical protein